MKSYDSAFYSPKEIVDKYIKLGVARVRIPFIRLFLLGVFAGIFVALGAASSSVAMHAVSNVGVSRILGGIIFPVGLMMILFVGGELFTSNCLMIMGIIDGKIKIRSTLRVLIILLISNFIGAMLIAFLVTNSGQLDYSQGLLGAYTLKCALGKVSTPFVTAFSSGVLCNIFVCIAVLMAAASKDIVGKVWAIFFPIMAFVVAGYEHVVANMYYIPAGILSKSNDAYTALALEQYGITAEQLTDLNWGSFIVNNVFPVACGNLLGGMLFVGIPLYIISRAKIKPLKETVKDMVPYKEDKK